MYVKGFKCIYSVYEYTCAIVFSSKLYLTEKELQLPCAYVDHLYSCMVLSIGPSTILGGAL